MNKILEIFLLRCPTAIAAKCENYKVTTVFQNRGVQVKYSVLFRVCCQWKYSSSEEHTPHTTHFHNEFQLVVVVIFKFKWTTHVFECVEWNVNKPILAQRIDQSERMKAILAQWINQSERLKARRRTSRKLSATDIFRLSVPMEHCGAKFRNFLYWTTQTFHFLFASLTLYYWTSKRFILLFF